MTDELALYKAILANPEDDALRLVYADCLEEQGRDGQANFVRLQLAWEREEPTLANLPRSKLLLRAWHTGWSERIVPVAAVLGWPHHTRHDFSMVWHLREDTNLTTTWRRGLVGEVFCTCADWYGRYRGAHDEDGDLLWVRGHGYVLMANFPVEKVTLTDKYPRQIGDGWRWFVEWPGAVMNDTSASLPDALFDAIYGTERDSESAYERRLFPSAQHALDALSRACRTVCLLPEEERPQD